MTCSCALRNMVSEVLKYSLYLALGHTYWSEAKIPKLKKSCLYCLNCEWFVCSVTASCSIRSHSWIVAAICGSQLIVGSSRKHPDTLNPNTKQQQINQEKPDSPQKWAWIVFESFIIVFHQISYVIVIIHEFRYPKKRWFRKKKKEWISFVKFYWY